MTSLFDQTVTKFSFPVIPPQQLGRHSPPTLQIPEPSYDAVQPLRNYTADGVFYRIDTEFNPEPFSQFQAQLLWLDNHTGRAPSSGLW